MTIRSIPFCYLVLASRVLLIAGLVVAVGCHKPEEAAKAAPSQVPAFLKAACEKDNAEACVLLGLFHRDGVLATPKDAAASGVLIKKALSLREAGCTKGDTDACSWLAYVYTIGTLVPKDEVRGAAFQKAPDDACTAGKGPACYRHAKDVLEVDKKAAKPLLVRAVALLKKECDAAEPSSCLALSEQVNHEEFGGKKGAPESTVFWNQGAAIYERQCNAGIVRSCRTAGDVLFAGSSNGDPDRTRAQQLYVRGCDLGDSECSANVGAQYAQATSKDRDDARAVATLKQSCGGGSAAGCSYLGQMYSLGRGGLPEDKENGAKLRVAACDAGHSVACINL